MPVIKRRVAALESRLDSVAKIEDLLKALHDEKMGIEVSEKEWQRIRNSPTYKFIESIVIKDEETAAKLIKNEV